MLKVRHFALYITCLVTSLMSMQLAQASNLPDFVSLVKETSSAVVNISTTQKIQTGAPVLPEGFEMPEFPEDSPFGELFKYFFEQEGNGDPGYRDAKSLGSGFIISKDGYVMTNYHVVKDADEIIVRLSDRRELKAEVIGVDPRSDVALLKIDATGLPVVRIGKSGTLEVGEWVLAIGSPFGFDHSATAGIVSAKGRSLPRENYVPFIQTDVAINPGNSGGPLFNQDGEVVGVNSQIYSRTGGYMGLSFAIPIEVAMDVADQLKTSGKVSRGWLGVLIQDVTLDLAESFGMRHPRGALVAKVLEDSPFGELFKYFFEQEGNGDPGYRDAKSLGSGFIISKDGYVMTNYHVVKDADEIIVRLSDRRELKAEVIGVDPRSDVALLKIDATGLPVVSIGKSAALEVGEWVLAIGSPFGFDHSATAGIVSAKGRSLPRENYVPFIQTDVAINPGNSGGPLFNQDGEVVGVNSQIYSRTGGYMGLSFAIPIEVAMDVADQLKTSGKVSRGWLGVLIQDVTLDLAESFGMRHPRGALVAKVLEDSPALDAGVKVGDIIVEFNGKEVINSSNLPPIVGSSKVGVKLPMVVIRNGKEKTLSVKLGELPEDTKVAQLGGKPDTKTTNRLGFSAVDLSDKQKEELQLDGGVLVNYMVTGSATQAGVRKGDIILAIDNTPVKNLTAFEKLVRGLPGGKSVALLVQRNGSPTFLAIKVPDDE